MRKIYMILALWLFSIITLSGAPIVVTPVGSPTPANNDFTVIQNALTAAVSNDIIDLQGTFNWTEPNAYASYLASYTASFSDDIRGVMIPDGVNNLTITTSTSCTINGPGEIVDGTLICEGFIFTYDGYLSAHPVAIGNSNLTISHLNILNFESAVMIGWNATGTYSGTNVHHNTIELTGDDGNATEWLQNIAIYFWVGTNQTIANNTITFQGDGIRTLGYGGGAAPPVSYGYQCATSGGAAYSGLQIINNTFQVGSTSNGIEKIYGIWENSHNDDNTCVMTISGNNFLGRSGDLFDYAFKLSSQTNQLSITNNTLTDVDNVYVGNSSAGNQAGDTYTFSNLICTNVGGSDGIFLENVTNHATPINIAINWNVNNTIDGETGVRGLNELSTQATHASRPSTAAENIDYVYAIGTSTIRAVDDDWSTTPRFGDPDGIGIGIYPAAKGFNNYTTVSTAISAAIDGDIVNIMSGTYTESSTINLNNALTIYGTPSPSRPVIQTAGTAQDHWLFKVSAPNVTMKNLDITKTNIADQNIIYLAGSNFILDNCKIHGQYTYDDGTVCRAMVVQAGAFSGIQISNNEFYNLRQPAYISGTSTGNITNNLTYGTKGWVLEGGNLTFTGNTWGTGAQANVFDIAILSSCPAIYYTDIVAMSNANNGAIIEDQRNSPALLSVVYVDQNSPHTQELGSLLRPYKTIAPAIPRVIAGGTVYVAAGTYDEDILIDKSLNLIGAEASIVSIRGVIGGSGSTIQVASSNVTIAGFTITRLGNNPAQWDLALNTAGIAIQGLSYSGVIIRDNILSGNRTAIDINASGGHTVRNNVIKDNRTGIVMRNQTDNLTIIENYITNNWTDGVLFLDASSGTNSPPQTALNCIISNNNISGNWYGQIVDRQTGGSLPAPGTNLKNFSGNWLGTITPVISTANSTEPGYSALIPVAYGGTAVPPGGQPDICGPASANIDYTPYLNSGTDTDVETTTGRGTNGFQGDFSNIWAVATSAQTGTAGRIQEAVGLAQEVQ